MYPHLACHLDFPFQSPDICRDGFALDKQALVDAVVCCGHNVLAYWSMTFLIMSTSDIPSSYRERSWATTLLSRFWVRSVCCKRIKSNCKDNKLLYSFYWMSFFSRILKITNTRQSCQEGLPCCRSVCNGRPHLISLSFFCYGFTIVDLKQNLTNTCVCWSCLQNVTTPS